jgi:putative ABC transport system permease protein
MSRLIILRNIQRNKLRTFLTVVGIAIGVSAVIGLLSISMGLRQSMDEQVSKLGQNFVIVVPGGGGFSAAIAFQEFGEKERSTIEGIAGVEHVAPRYTTSAKLEFKDKEFDTRIGGVRAEDLEFMVDKEFIALDQGSVFTGKRRIVLGRDIWKSLDKPEIGQSIELGGEKFKISGILEAVSMPGFGSLVITPLESVWEIAKVEDKYSVFIVFVSDPKVAERIDQKLEQLLGEDEYTVMTNEQMVEQAAQILGVIDGFLIAITGVSLIVGVLGIANTMFVSITERISQIGVMKTLGATNTKVANMIVQESAAIGLLGGVVGVIVGILLGLGIEFIASIYEIELRSFVPIEMMVVAITGTILLGVISGLLPAWQASKMDPVEAMKL